VKGSGNPLALHATTRFQIMFKNNIPRQRNARLVSGRPTRSRREPAAKRATGRSLHEFQPLLPGEAHLLQACQQGRIAKLGDQVPETPSDALTVRATFLRFLLLGGDEKAPVHERGTQLQGAVIDGPLDLGGCLIPHNVLLHRCQFTHFFVAQDSQVQGSVTLEGSHLLGGINADRIQCEGGLFLRNGFKATGEVRLLGAQIGGNLDCNGGQFEVEEGNALSADRAVVKGDVFLCDGFKATGVVRLLGAQIGGSLNCNGGQFEIKEGNALSADGLVVNGDVFLNKGFKATGVVRLLGAQIGGDLTCNGGQFEVKEGDALSADRSVVKGYVFLCDGFKATGVVRLLGAQIGGSLNCNGGQFEVKEGNALSADGLVVKGDIVLNGGFKATGVVRLLGAQIGGSLNCSDGQFEVKEGNALSADRSVVNGSVFLNGGFKATGVVRLLGAQIGGTLNCSSGQFEVKEGNALSADGSVVKGNVFLNGGFKATGVVRLLGAQIGGNLECTGGHFEVKKGHALNLEKAVIKGAWLFRKQPHPLCVNASHMQLDVLVDEIDSWDSGSVLDGLRYSALGGSAPTAAKTRREWLNKQPLDHLGIPTQANAFRPQPWRQLQRVLRDMGHAEDARQIGMAYEEQLRKADLIGRTAPETSKPMAAIKRFISRVTHTLFGWLSGYGYRPMRLVYRMFVVWLICGIGYWCLALPPHNAIGPSDPLIYQNKQYADCVLGSPQATSAAASCTPHAGNWYLCAPLPAEYSTLSPFAYSLDILLPFVDLGQEKAWGPLVPTPKELVWEEVMAFSAGHAVRWLVWFETMFGWVGGLLLVGIVSGFSRRSEE